MTDTRILLFDIDGTLLLSGGAGNRALERAMAQVTGRSGGMEDVLPDGKTDYLIIEEAFRVNFTDLHLGSGDIEKVLQLYLEALEDEIWRSEKFRLMPGVPQVLDACRDAGHRMGLATGNIEEGSKLKLRRAGLLDYFEFGGFGSDAADRTEMTRIAVGKAREVVGEEVPNEHIFVIGDTPHDILCAKEAGVKAVGVGAARFSCDELQHHHPDILLEDLSHPEDLLEAIQ